MQRGGLSLSCRHINRGNQPGTVPLVVAQAVNIDLPGWRTGFNFKGDGGAVIDANVRGKPLDRGGSRSAEIPLALGSSRQLILRNNCILRQRPAHAECRPKKCYKQSSHNLITPTAPLEPVNARLNAWAPTGWNGSALSKIQKAYLVSFSRSLRPIGRLAMA